MYQQQKIIVVLPAYNAANTLEMTVRDIPEIVDEILLVDDKSSDKTLEKARELGLFVFPRALNGGYGANQKDCYRLALERGADIIVMLHPDYQYDPKLIIFFVQFLEANYFDIMLGSRIRSRREAMAGGMPLYKYLSNRFLTILENFASGYNLSEWHTGMRAYRRDVLEKIDWQNNSDDFVFDSEMLFKAIAKKFRIGEIPVPVRYFPAASSINFRRSLRYGLETLGVAVRYLLGKYR
jgi:glycosyltransferase involved in cell wall biosynthesis